MSKIKVYMVSHLNTEQNAREQRPEAYLKYGEDVAQWSNVAINQKHLQCDSIRLLAGGCDG